MKHSTTTIKWARAALTLLLASLTSVGAWADEGGTCGEGLTYTYVESTNTLTISGTGAMEDYDFFYSSPWYSYCDEITTLNIGDDVTSIGNTAFYDCTSLTSVTIPDNVKSIGNHAFESCTSLTSVTISDNVKSIGYYAFAYCTSLESVDLGSGVETIGESAFRECYPLATITGGENVESIATMAFYETAWNFDIWKDPGMHYVGKVAYRCTDPKLTSIVIKDGTVAIGHNCFDNRWNLQSVTLPNSVKVIESSAFLQCYNLKDITFPSSLTTIGAYAFEDCEELEIIRIGANVTSIGVDAFGGCTGLTDVYCLAAPSNLTWEEGECNDFITDETDSNYPTKIHVADKAAFEAKWKTGNAETDVNASFVQVPDHDCSADGHLWGETKSSEPTCTKKGGTRSICQVCGEIDLSVIPALGHLWGEWYLAEEPSCIYSGWMGSNCERCGEYQSEEIPALGHLWNSEDVCDRCGIEMNPTLIALGNEGIGSYYKSNYTLSCLYEGCTLSVKLADRTLKGGKWNTLSLPFALTAEQIADSPLAGATIRALDGCTTEGEADEQVTVGVKFAGVTEMEANTPYIVYPAADIVEPVFTDVLITTESNYCYKDGIAFVAILDPCILHDNEYVLFLQDNNLYYPTDCVEVYGCRGYFYLDWPAATSGDAKIVIDWGEDVDAEATEIEGLATLSGDDAWYTLSGMKLEGKPTEKGIYIVNGKKVAVK